MDMLMFVTKYVYEITVTNRLKIDNFSRAKKS